MRISRISPYETIKQWAENCWSLISVAYEYLDGNQHGWPCSFPLSLPSTQRASLELVFVLLVPSYLPYPLLLWNLALRKESGLSYLHLIHLNVNVNLDIDTPRGIRMMSLCELEDYFFCKESRNQYLNTFKNKLETFVLCPAFELPGLMLSICAFRSVCVSLINSTGHREMGTWQNACLPLICKLASNLDLGQFGGKKIYCTVYNEEGVFDDLCGPF